MILVIGGIKGGTGKTTLATNLTILRSQRKKKVMLIDADDQRSSSDWWHQRHGIGNMKQSSFNWVSLIGRSIHVQIQKFADEYDDIIVDTGGRDTMSQRSALIVANAFLVPFKPRSLDIWTISNVNALIDEIRTVNHKLMTYTVLNQCDSRGSDNQDALKILKEHSQFNCIDTFIGSRKAFCNAAGEGLGVSELGPKSDDKAVQELTKVHDAIFSKQ